MKLLIQSLTWIASLVLVVVVWGDILVRVWGMFGVNLPFSLFRRRTRLVDPPRRHVFAISFGLMYFGWGLFLTDKVCDFVLFRFQGIAPARTSVIGLLSDLVFYSLLGLGVGYYLHKSGGTEELWRSSKRQ